MTTQAGRTERVFVVFVLLLSAGAFSSLWTVPGETQTAAGALVMQVLWSLIYIATLYFFFHHCEQPLRRFFSEWPLVALCLFAMVSVVWSQAPGLTFRRSVALSLTLLFGVYFASRFSSKEQLRLLAWTCAICAVSSFIFGAFGLGNSVNSGQGVLGWYGIFDQKNDLGRMMVLSVLVFFSWKRAEPEHKWLANTGLIGALVLIVLSRSMTAVIVLALLIVLLPYFKWTAMKSMPWFLAGITVLGLAGAASMGYAITHLQEVTGLLGKTATLTGRIPIWILSVVMALRRPWLGYGYNAFWLSNQMATVRIWHVLAWTAPNAHNGYLELWLELGLVGTGLFVLALTYYVWRSIGFLRQPKGAEVPLWPLMFLVFDVLINLTETNFLSRNNIFFVLLIGAAMATNKRGVWLAPYRDRAPLENPA